MNFDLLKGWMNETYGYLNSNLRETAVGMLKIELLLLVPIMVTVAMAVALMFFAPPGLELVSFIIALGFILIGLLLSGAVGSAGFNLVDNITKRKKTDIIGTVEDNLVPYIKYALVMVGIVLVPILPLLAVLFLAYLSAPLLGSLVEILVRILITIISAVIYLFLQFAIMEAILSRNGTLDSFRKSYRMARKNFASTAIMSFLLWIVENVINLAVLIVVGIVALLFLILVVGSVGADIKSLQELLLSLALPALAALIIAFAVIVIITDAAVRAILYPARYFFWKKIKY